MGGASALDLPRLRLESRAEAEAYLLSYGFDTSIASQRDQLRAIRMLALSFIDGTLLPEVPGVSVLPAVRAQDDAVTLLLWASDPARGLQQRWSCALLRVMHTVAHARLQLQERFGTSVRTQILARFTPHLTQEGDAWRLGTGERSIPLVDFQVRHTKPVDSVVLKLLHKPDNVASDIFDQLAVRFVTHERLDALLVARYLRQNHMVSVPNIKPSRSRNTLLDMLWVEREIELIEETHGHLSPAEQLQLLRERVAGSPYPEPPHKLNPHSAFSYQAIQLTARHYVRVNDVGQPGEVAFFFPYEVQIMDQRSWQDSRSGVAAHTEYKRRQRESVRRRVLGPVLDWVAP